MPDPDPERLALVLALPWRLRPAALAATLAGRPWSPACRAALARRGGLRLRRREAREWLARSRRDGQGVLCAGRPPYPSALLELHDPPPLLFASGDTGLLARGPRVAVVGTRRARPAALSLARALGGELARAGLPVASGLALGIDGEAHRGCVEAGGAGIAVLGTGLDVDYPWANRGLKRELREGGLLLSEHPAGAPGRPWQFLARNRVIAALARAVVVVQAPARSGALSTADFALQLGRELLVVPASPGDAAFAGNLGLLREGARCALAAADVLDALHAPRPAPTLAAAPLGLGTEPESPPQLARRLGWPLPRVLAELGALELDGRVRRLPDGRYVATGALAPGAAGG